MVQIISWISDSLMLPVLILLLALFFYSLVLLGSFFSLYMRLLENHRNLKKVMSGMKDPGQLDMTGPENSSFISRIRELAELDWHPVHCEKRIAEYHQDCGRDLDRSKFLIKIGPMLGLMGTLIPMGPALVALANGDISSMALNMQVAFSTTVMGIFIGAVGFITYSVKSRWYNEEIANIQYVLELRLHAGEQDI
jgi:biopolymer transport protein ExbB/TolQ